MATVTLTQENFEQTVSAGGIVLVDFWATWCGPCRQFGPIFEEASEKYPDIVFGKIDTDDQQQLAMAAQITSIPTLMVFRDGIAVFRQSGALPLSALEDLISQVQNLDMDEVRKQIAVYCVRHLCAERSREAAGDEFVVGVVAHHERVVADDLEAVARVEALRPVVFAPDADP